MFVEPGEHAFLNVELVSILLNGVALARINDQFSFHPYVFQAGIKLVSLPDRYTPVVYSMRQECGNLIWNSRFTAYLGHIRFSLSSRKWKGT